MNIDLYILAFSAVTVLVTIWMGFRSAKKSKTASDFFVAGRSVSVGWNASAISGEYLSAASFMGIAGMVMSSGYDALWYPVCYACGYLFLLLFIAGPLRRFGAYTIPDFAEGRFDSPVFRKIAVVFVLFIGFFYTMPQMKGAGVTLAYIFPGLPYWVGVVLVGAVITLNVALGGMKGITLVQAFQYWAKMFAISVPIFVLMAVYGHYGKQLEVNDPAKLARNIGPTSPMAGTQLEFRDLREVVEEERLGVRPTVKQQAERTLDHLLTAFKSRPAISSQDRVSLNCVQCSLWQVLDLYSACVGKHVIVANIGYTQRNYSFNSGGSISGEEAVGLIAAQLRTNSLEFIPMGNDVLVATTTQWKDKLTTYLSDFSYSQAKRLALPAKAPADATWLNPFGPLTTKAAKTAAAAIGKKAAASASLSTAPPANYVMIYEESPTNSPPAFWKRPVRDLLGHKTAAQLGIVVNDSIQFPQGSCHVPVLLYFYGTISHKTVYCDERMIHSDVVVPSNLLVGDQFLKTARATLETNFIVLVSETESEVRFASTNYDAFFAAQLDSAIQTIRRTGHGPPKPATYVGGIIGDAMARTPKAEKESREGAKSAKQNASSSFANFAASRDTIPLCPGLSPDQRMTVALDSPTVAQALGVYAELTGRQLLPNTNSLAERADDLLGGKLSALKIITRPPAPDSGVREHGDGMFTAAEVKKSIETQLRAQGLALVPAGERGFRAVAVPEAGDCPHKVPVSLQRESSARNQGIAAVPDELGHVPNGKSAVPNEKYGVPFGGNGVPNEKYGVPFERNTVPNGGNGVPFGKYGVPNEMGQAPGEAGFAPNSANPVLFAQNTPVNPGSPSLIPPGAILAPQGAVPGASAIGAAAEKAWLAKHEKPLALLYTYSLIIAIVCGTAGLPHILVRFYTNPDGAAAKRTTMWVMILIGVFYVFPPVFGALGRNLMPDLYTGLAGIKGTDQVVLKLPVLLNEKYPPLGSILSGITCAGAFAAFMSTFSGLLVSMTGALAHDVYGRILRPKSTPEQRMRMFKIGAVLIGGVAVLLGSFVEPLEINFMVGQAFAIAAASYFPLLFMAVWWRKLTMKGAAIGMLTGGACALVAAALTNFSNLALDKGPMGKIFAGFAPLNNYWADHPLLRILCEQPAIWAVPLAITLMVIVSKLTAKSIPEDIRMKMLVLHAPEQLGLKQEYIQEHQPGH